LATNVTYRFPLRLRSSKSRLAFTIAGIPFEDERIPFHDWPDFQQSTPFGKIPVLSIDGGPYRGQSGGILRWIGTELYPSLYPKELALDIDEAVFLIEDFHTARVPIMVLSLNPESYGHPKGWNDSEEGQRVIGAMVESFVTVSLPRFLGYIQTMLERNEETWIATSHDPSIADCMAVTILRSLTLGDVVPQVPKDCLDGFPVVVAYVKRFCSLPQVADRYTLGLR
jgi:prostaglandin-H2 D-isomerase / glutathione transferase